jgi:ATP-dependent Clp protease ATP-binding subunit ClpC
MLNRTHRAFVEKEPAMIVQQQTPRKDLGKDSQEVLKLAKDAATEYGLGYVGTEHLLLGIVRCAGCFGADVLMSLGVNEYNAKSVVDKLIEKRAAETWVMGRLPGTPHFKDVVNKAADVSRGTGNWQIASEHLLLALASERGSMGFTALETLGVNAEAVKKAIIDLRAAK